MNLFYLSDDYSQAAEWHCDKHVVKMIVENCQMLSTAHRMLDGKHIEFTYQDNGKTKTRNFLALFDEVPTLAESISASPDSEIFVITVKPILASLTGRITPYALAHSHHPTTKWVAACRQNYEWTVKFTEALIQQFRKRYKKPHGCEKVFYAVLTTLPSNIADGVFTQPPLSMPGIYKTACAIDSYRRFYAGEKWSFLKWTDTPVPSWIFEKMDEVWPLRPNARFEELNEVLSRKNLSAHEELVAHAQKIIAKF